MKRYKKMIISNRDDGFGERMCSLLNAMYISKILNLRFGFVWKKKVDSLLYEYTETDKYLCCNDCIDKNDIFHEDFIKKFHRDDISSSIRHSFFKIKGSSIQILKNKPYEYSFGWQSCQEDLSLIFNDVKEQQYRKILRESWKEIQFSSRVNRVISYAENISREFKNGFIAIHIRSGDIVFEFKGHSRWLIFAAYKAVSFNLVASMIEFISNSQDIIIFSDDIESARIIKNHCSKKNIFLAQELLNDKTFSKDEIDIFEIVLMSKSLEIYHSGNSGFSRLAYFIGTSKSICIYKYFSKIQQYNFILNNIKILDLSKKQKAYSYFMLFIFAREMRFSKERQLYFLEQGSKEDPNNQIFILSQIEIYFIMRNYKKIEHLIQSIINRGDLDSFLKMLLTKSYDLGCYDNFVLFNSYLLNMNEKLLNQYSYISLITYLIGQDIYINFDKFKNFYENMHICFLELLFRHQDIFSRILKKYFFALKLDFKELNTEDYFKIIVQLKNNPEARIKNSLAYKLGYGFIKSKNIIQMLFFLYNMNSVIAQHKENITEFGKFLKNKNNTYRLKRNKNYYIEVKRLRNHLSYLIGVEIINSHNSFFKLGYLLLPGKLMYIIIKRKIYGNRI
ncbi:hypothetical protein ACD571_05975 [Campylobacter sp. LH-2024]|uniref:hypothetical protein n=1 Tax=Campylobacter sp. LH-2024 TaxID=3239825 RepID=UPI003AA7F0D9